MLLVILVAVVILGKLMVMAHSVGPPSAQALMLCLEKLVHSNIKMTFLVIVINFKPLQITSTYEFWVDGKKEETLQCFKSKGLNVNEDVSEDGVQTTSIRGHVVLNLYDDPRIQYIFSGLNPSNIMAPGLYYMQVSRCGSLFFLHHHISYIIITYAHVVLQGGEFTEVGTVDSETRIITSDYSDITGTFVDVCAELKAALSGGGGGGACVDKEKGACKDDGNCMWKRKKSECVSKTMPWN